MHEYACLEEVRTSLPRSMLGHNLWTRLVAISVPCAAALAASFAIVVLRRRRRYRLPPPTSNGCFGIVVGSSPPDCLRRLELTAFVVSTPFGSVTLHRAADPVGRGVSLILLYRHTPETTTLATNINHRANIWALRAAGVTVLLLTSSVGVMSDDVPLWTPMLVEDLLMLENRLPDGSPCSFGEGYLIAPGTSLFSTRLCTQLQEAWVARHGEALRRVAYWYQLGPRVKTKVETRALLAMGAEVNSMTLGPEIVLANELSMAVVAAGIGHVGATGFSRQETGVQASLQCVDFSTVVECFLSACDPLTPCESFLHRR